MKLDGVGFPHVRKDEMTTDNKHLVEPLSILSGTVPGVQVELHLNHVHYERGDLVSTLLGRRETFDFDKIASVHLYESRHANQGLFVLMGHDGKQLMEMHYPSEQHHQALEIQRAIEIHIQQD